ncbi:NmrA-like family [Aspergillus sclerotialis]|uniref:NmrA-like family n=1 Tax=Aspergillus sclerotialis TaxID=2070753 RepID=A0A3A2Z3W5_9EURO|nr:NmrA-like family [Aspergillus sclerotialis]
MPNHQNILVLGAGELGTQVLTSLARHPQNQSTSISVLLRPSSISSSDPSRTQKMQTFKSLNITPIPGDIVTDTLEKLSEIFTPFDAVISCTGFIAGKGTQLKITQAVLAAGVKRYIPWQFGVDYDVIGRGSGHELFDEQLDVRHLLRQQNKTKWVIISTGMFTSFVFEPSFGVIDIPASKVTALGSWENRVTLTTPEDIGVITAEVVSGSESEKTFGDKATYIGGDTVSYAQLAGLVEKVTGREFERRCLTVDEVKGELVRDPENALRKYQLVFGMGRGVAWGCWGDVEFEEGDSVDYSGGMG